jgi:hypothetical protein
MWTGLSSRTIWRLPSQRLLRGPLLGRRCSGARRGGSSARSARLPSRLRRLRMPDGLLIRPVSTSISGCHCSTSGSPTSFAYIRRMGSVQKWPRNKKSETGLKVQLYSSAYKLAWEQISSAERRERPQIPLRIHASIRRQLKAGETDARTIAFEALKEALVPEPHS